jgi:hypothetical protein
VDAAWGLDGRWATKYALGQLDLVNFVVTL